MEYNKDGIEENELVETEKAATEEQLNKLLKLDFPELKEPEYDDIFWK